MYRTAIIILSALTLFFVGVIVSKSAPTVLFSTTELAQQRIKDERAKQAQQADAARERLINRVIQPYNKMVSMCDYLAQFSYFVPQAQLPIKCAELRVSGNLAIERIQTMKDLNLLSRQVDQFEVAVASPLRDMEATYAMVQRLMK
jgi:hypothetical protein